MSTIVKWRPETKRQRHVNRNDAEWYILCETGEFLCVKAAHDIRWIKRNQVTAWRFI